MAIAERFWEQVERINGGCWLWTGKKIRGGYGDFVIAGRHIIAHRWSWMEANGAVPEGLLVLHRCDNPPCVNPMHLFLGTQQDNMDDQLAKGRRPPAKGEQNKHARLTATQVEQIRDLVRQGLRNPAVAARFGICPQYVSAIASGKSWGHLPLIGNPAPLRKRGRARDCT